MEQIFHVSFPGLGIDNLMINRVAFSLDLFGRKMDIYWYGIIIAAAFLICMLISLRTSREFNFVPDDILDSFLLIVPLSIIGARLYYVAFSWDHFKEDLTRIFQTRYGGMGFYGGVIGGIIALLLISRLKKRPVSDFTDFFAPVLALGQGIGRWGNFINQEAFGTNTDLPWGMISEGTRKYLSEAGPQYAANSPVHPTFLYEFIGNLLIFFLLLIIRRKSTFRFQTTAWYFGLYGLLRYFTEGLRTDSLMIGDTGIRVSQALSLVMIVIAVLYLTAQHIRQGRTPKEQWLLPFEGHEASIIDDMDESEVSTEEISESPAEADFEDVVDDMIAEDGSDQNTEV